MATRTHDRSCSSPLPLCMHPPATSTPWTPVQNATAKTDEKAWHGGNGGFGTSRRSGNLQLRTWHEIIISCTTRPAKVPPSPTIQPLLFKGTSGKGSNKDSPHYVPKSALAVTLPSLLCSLRLWLLDHLYSRCSSPKPQTLTWSSLVFCPLLANGDTVSV